MRKESIFLLFLFGCHIGHALDCYSCIGECKEMTRMTCGPNQQCITKERRTNGRIDLQQRGCAEAVECNNASPDPSLTHTCCNTELCNAVTTTTSPTSTSTSVSTSSASTKAGAGAGGSGSALMCYTCTDYTCIIRDTVKCKAGDLCLIKSADFLGGRMKKLGCGNTTICSKQTSEVIMVNPQTVDNKCCDTNLCNFAITLKFPSIAIIGSVLFLMIIKLY